MAYAYTSYSTIFNSSPGFNKLPGICQGFIFPDENTFINISHVIPPIYLHDKVHTTQPHLFLRTSWHHAFHTSWYCIQLTFYLFQEKVEQKRATTNLPKFQINTCNKPGKYLWTTDCRSIPVTSQETIYLKRLKINTWKKPGKLSFFLRSEINTWNQPGQLSHRPTFLSPNLIPVASQENIYGRLIVD